jgi:hypothetical protein
MVGAVVIGPITIVENGTKVRLSTDNLQKHHPPKDYEIPISEELAEKLKELQVTSDYGLAIVACTDAPLELIAFFSFHLSEDRTVDPMPSEIALKLFNSQFEKFVTDKEVRDKELDRAQKYWKKKALQKESYEAIQK